MKALSYRKSKLITYICFLFMPLFFLLVFTYYPAFKLIQISLSDWNGYSPNINFIGLRNYINVFKDGSVFKFLMNNLAYIALMIIQTIAALYFAIILNTKLRGKSFFKSTIFMPYIMNGIAIAFMFSFVFSFNEGPLNVLIRGIGLENYAVHWFGNNYFINFTLAFIVLWRYLGWDLVIFLGALQSINGSLYEAAYIDGATFFQIIRYIIIPSIKPVIKLLFFLGLNGSLQVFFEPYVITQGGPAGRSETFSTMVYKYAFQYQNFGKASALGVILTLFIVLILILQNLATKKSV